MQLSLSTWAGIAACVFVLNWVAYRFYYKLLEYRGWQSPWKRLAFVCPLPLATIGLLVGVWYVTTH